ncbi:hypothetical protein FH484_19640 [Escherichia coli]|nr:hypothetical protein [Escherichia coli]
MDTRASLRLSAFSSLISSLAVANVLSPFLIFSMALSSLSEDVAPRKLFSTTTLSDAHCGEGESFSLYSPQVTVVFACCTSGSTTFYPDAPFSPEHATAPH